MVLKSEELVTQHTVEDLAEPEINPTAISSYRAEVTDGTTYQDCEMSPPNYLHLLRQEAAIRYVMADTFNIKTLKDLLNELSQLEAPRVDLIAKFSGLLHTDTSASRGAEARPTTSLDQARKVVNERVNKLVKIFEQLIPDDVSHNEMLMREAIGLPAESKLDKEQLAYFDNMTRLANKKREALAYRTRKSTQEVIAAALRGTASVSKRAVLGAYHAVKPSEKISPVELEEAPQGLYTGNIPDEAFYDRINKLYQQSVNPEEVIQTYNIDVNSFVDYFLDKGIESNVAIDVVVARSIPELTDEQIVALSDYFSKILSEESEYHLRLARKGISF